MHDFSRRRRKKKVNVLYEDMIQFWVNFYTPGGTWQNAVLLCQFTQLASWRGVWIFFYADARLTYVWKLYAESIHWLVYIKQSDCDFSGNGFFWPQRKNK